MVLLPVIVLAIISFVFFVIGVGRIRPDTDLGEDMSIEELYNFVLEVDKGVYKLQEYLDKAIPQEEFEKQRKYLDNIAQIALEKIGKKYSEAEGAVKKVQNALSVLKYADLLVKYHMYNPESDENPEQIMKTVGKDLKTLTDAQEVVEKVKEAAQLEQYKEKIKAGS